MFCSDLFEGSISDRQITIDSGFLDFIEAGDLVLADRGFVIHDLLSSKNASLIQDHVSCMFPQPFGICNYISTFLRTKRAEKYMYTFK